MGRRTAKAVAFWAVLAAAAVLTVAFALTTDRWWMSSRSGAPLALGHGVATAIVQMTSAEVDRHPFDYYSAEPIWFALPAINRGLTHAVIVLPIAPAIACLAVASFFLWPLAARRGIATKAWRFIAIGGLLASAFLVSAFWATGIEGRSITAGAALGRQVTFEQGAVGIITDDVPGLSASPLGGNFRPPPTAPEPVWLPTSRSTRRGTGFLVPLWMPAAVLSVLTWTAWRLALKRPDGGCRWCGYNLQGLPDSSACPECGRVRTPRAKRGRLRAFLFASIHQGARG